LKLLDRYLISQYTKYFFTLNIAFVSLYVLIDFFEKIDDFQSRGKSIGLALEYFSLNLPFIVDQLSPILILLSGVIALGILNHNHELVALKAGGIPLKTIVKPIILAGIGATLLFLAVAQWLLPYTIATTNNIWFEQVKGKIQLGIYRNGRYYFKGKEGFYSFKWENQEKLFFRDFSYSRWDENHNLEMLLSADEAYYDHDQWVLKIGQTQFVKNGEYVTTPFTETRRSLPEKPENFLIPQYDFAALSITQLFQNIFKQESEQQKTKAWADFSGRLSYIFLGLPLLLMGLPILLLTYAKWGRDLSIAIPISCGMAFLAWGIWGALQSLAGAGAVSPLLSGTVIHLIFSSAGLYMLYKQNQ